MTPEARQFNTPHRRRILREITTMAINDPDEIPLSTIEKETIIWVVSRSLEAKKLSQILRLATMADRLNARRSHHTRITARIAGLFEAKAPGLDDEHKTKAHLPKLFVELQSQAATELGEAVFRGDKYIAHRYCGPITKHISATNATELDVL